MSVDRVFGFDVALRSNVVVYIVNIIWNSKVFRVSARGHVQHCDIRNYTLTFVPVQNPDLRLRRNRK